MAEPTAVEQMAAEQGPRWGSRKLAWLDGFHHGAQHARMTGADREQLATLLAGLKAEVETLRRIQKHEEEMQAQWEREAPLQDEQAWSAQNVASASKDIADRLEHLIKQAGGEA